MLAAGQARYSRRSYRPARSFSGQKDPETAPFQGFSPSRKIQAHWIKSDVGIDPACGSGNFLTETYLSLRRLENQMLGDLNLADKSRGTMFFSFVNPIKVSISQFCGIEINDFAVTVAKTALWIAESQTMKETENIVSMHIDFLPLKTNAYIHEGNALRLDWEQIVPKNELNYIMGNPPFVGKKYQSKNPKADMKYIFGEKTKGVGNLDYVTEWYKKATDYMQTTSITAAFVSTNSIVNFLKN